MNHTLDVLPALGCVLHGVTCAEAAARWRGATVAGLFDAVETCACCSAPCSAGRLTCRRCAYGGPR